MKLPMTIASALFAVKSFAQLNTPSPLPQTSDATQPSPTAMNLTTTYPTATVFAPIDIPDHLGGSVISAFPDRTIIAIGCLPAEDCGIATSITVTNGESTFICTNTIQDPEGSTTPNPLTVNCHLSGSPAIAATCIGESAISGLGNLATTSTLAETQIKYAYVTITAGVENLRDVVTRTSGMGAGGRSTSSGLAAPAVTAMGREGVVRWAAGAAFAGVGMAVGVL